MRTFKVYLAGPIAGLTYDEAQDWRAKAKFALEQPFPGGMIQAYSPLRGKADVLPAPTAYQPAAKFAHPLATDRAIMRRDHFDCVGADAILANLERAPRPSLGTAMELAWAYDHHIPVVAIYDDGGLHDHPMIREAISHRARDLPEAIRLIRSILLP